MSRRFAATVATMLAVTAPCAARAEHAAIELRVYGPGSEKAAASDQEPPAGGVNERPLLKVRPGDALTVQFFLTNVYPHGELKDVTVRYFVVKLQAAGQKKVPPLGDAAVTEGQFTLHFKPKARVGARFQLAIKEPGVYLVRVETQNTKSDHEHFSAIDVQVE